MMVANYEYAPWLMGATINTKDSSAIGRTHVGLWVGHEYIMAQSKTLMNCSIHILTVAHAGVVQTRDSWGFFVMRRLEHFRNHLRVTLER